MDAAKRKLGLMVSTAPDHPNLTTALGLATAALDRGGEVYLYLIDEGVAAIEDRRIQALGERGARLFVCAYATNCGLVVLTDVINGTDRFLSLN